MYRLGEGLEIGLRLNVFIAQFFKTQLIEIIFDRLLIKGSGAMEIF